MNINNKSILLKAAEQCATHSGELLLAHYNDKTAILFKRTIQRFQTLIATNTKIVYDVTFL